MATALPQPRAPSPPPTPPNPRQAALDKTAHLRTDLQKALALIHRSEHIRAFMLDASPTTDLHLLTAPRPIFIIQTEEVQHGALPGRIAMRYLGIPAFTDQNGLSGGAVVTTYTSRTHPLHAPAVMAAVRVGRYVRDDRTGEWCIITRNVRDGLTRVQHISTPRAATRERICLTCTSSLFDAGLHGPSVLFQCHDVERRACAACVRTARCRCSPPLPPAVAAPAPAGDLAAAAALVVREGATSWAGTVRVTVVSNVSGSSLLDLDACMAVRSRYTPSIDKELAAHMQRLAIFEKATAETCIAPSLCAPSPPQPPASLQQQQTVAACHAEPTDDAERNSSSGTTDFEDTLLAPEMPLQFDGDFFAEPEGTDDVVDEILHDTAALLRGSPLHETAMMPADPSTLPGGIELCMDGMDTDCGWYSTLDAALPAPVPAPLPAPVLMKLEPETVPAPAPAPAPAQPPAPTPAKQEATLATGTATAGICPRTGARLAPRPPGMAVTGLGDEGFVWQMGMQGGAQAMAMNAYFEAKEKERKAEERRKKNRQAAARSNARKKGVMDGIKSDIKQSKARATRLRDIEMKLRSENAELKRRLSNSGSGAS